MKTKYRLVLWNVISDVRFFEFCWLIIKPNNDSPQNSIDVLIQMAQIKKKQCQEERNLKFILRSSGLL